MRPEYLNQLVTTCWKDWQHFDFAVGNRDQAPFSIAQLGNTQIQVFHQARHLRLHNRPGRTGLQDDQKPLIASLIRFWEARRQQHQTSTSEQGPMFIPSVSVRYVPIATPLKVAMPLETRETRSCSRKESSGVSKALFAKAAVNQSKRSLTGWLHRFQSTILEPKELQYGKIRPVSTVEIAPK